MRETDPRHLIVPQGQHVAVSVENVTEVAYSESSADIVKKSKDVSFFRIESGAPQCNLLGAMGGDSAVVAPRSRISFFGLGQKTKRLFFRRNHENTSFLGESGKERRERTLVYGKKNRKRKIAVWCA